MFQKQKSFVLKANFHTWKNACGRELARTQDMGQGCRHSSRNMHTCT